MKTDKETLFKPRPIVPTYQNPSIWDKWNSVMRANNSVIESVCEMIRKTHVNENRTATHHAGTDAVFDRVSSDVLAG